MQYRPEIDGLRAVAVLPVILFHAGMVSGGYIGVDIFFVISGYLITGILLHSLQANNFSFAKFYERRARRILPALSFISVVCIPFAWVLLSPDQLIDFGESLIAVTFFVSNFFFWLEKDYFSLPIEYIPLIHTWSLAAEEQFYVLFPMLLLFVWKFCRRLLLLILLFLVVASLCFAQLISAQEPGFNFYLLPSRIWELMFGACLVYTEINYGRYSNTFFKACMPTLGLILIAISVLIFNHETLHPSFITLIPVLGTGAIIWFSGGTDICSQILKNKMIVGIGLISYSIYLWHQPILAFSRLDNVGQLSTTAKIYYIPLTILLAYITWRYIEMPFRNKNRISLKVLLICLLSFSAVMILSGALLYWYKGFPARSKIPLAVRETFSRGLPSNPCAFNKLSKENWYCTLGNTHKKNVDFVLLGDSHANALINAFSVAANKSNSYGIASTLIGCFPLFGVTGLDKANSLQCADLNNNMYEYVKQHKVKNVVLVAKWDGYINRIYKNFAADKFMHRASRKQMLLESELHQTIDKYNDIGANVILVMQVPIQTNYPYEIYNAVYSQDPAEREYYLRKYSLPREYQTYNIASFLNFVNAVPHDHVKTLDFTKEFCDTQVCLVGTLDTSYYSDDDHLSAAGSKKIIDPLITLLSSFN